MAKQKTCTQCGDKYSRERERDYCMKQECVDAYIAGRRSGMAINLIPKSGFTVVWKNDTSSIAKTTKG